MAPRGSILKFMLKKGLVASALCVAVSMVSCEQVDYNVGGDLVPDNSKMTFVADTLENFNAYTRTVDSVATSMLGYTMLGNTTTPYVGSTDFSFISTYLPNTDSLWGTNPTIDSVKFVLRTSPAGGDSLLPQVVYINKVNKYLESFMDTTYYSNFNFADYVDPNPIAVMTTIDSSVNKVNLPISFAKPLLDTTGQIYQFDTLFLKKHFGLMLSTAKHHTEGVYSNVILASSGIEVYYRNQNVPTPDTLMAFFTMENNQRYNTSFTMIKRDFTTADPVIGVNDAIINTEEAQSTVYVQGQAGLLTKLDLKKEYFDAIKESAKLKGFSTIVISNATLTLPVVDPTPASMTRSVPRLGAYYDYAAYGYLSDEENDSSTSYDGTLNRAKNRYTMDITEHIQSIFMNESSSTSDDEVVNDKKDNLYVIELANAVGINGIKIEFLPNLSTLDATKIELNLKYVMLK